MTIIAVTTPAPFTNAKLRTEYAFTCKTCGAEVLMRVEHLPEDSALQDIARVGVSVRTYADGDAVPNLAQFDHLCEYCSLYA